MVGLHEKISDLRRSTIITGLDVVFGLEFIHHGNYLFLIQLPVSILVVLLEDVVEGLLEDVLLIDGGIGLIFVFFGAGGACDADGLLFLRTAGPHSDIVN